MSQKAKQLLEKIPGSAGLYWRLIGSRKSWKAHFRLDGLKKVLPQAVAEAAALKKEAADPKKICVFSTLHYWIEQSMLVGLGLAGFGHEIVFSWLPYADWDQAISLFDLREQDLYCRDILRPAARVMTLESLLEPALAAGKTPRLSADLQAIVDKVSDYDTQYTLQIEETDKTSALYKLRQQRNAQAAAALMVWLKRESPDLLIVPNGTILEMGVAWQIASLLGIPTVTFEFADQQERIWIAQNDEIMSHHTDKLWQGLGGQPLPEKARQALLELFAARKHARLWGNFARQWQQNPVLGGASVRESLRLDARPLALLATNVLGDSLTLGRQRITSTMAEMIVGTIGYFIRHPQLQLVVRVHPGELKTHGTSMVEVIEKAFPTLPENIHIIRPEDKTNTYDLVEIADFGLVYTTTVGLEMAMAGLPVIVTGKTHYAEKGFTWEPNSWQDYEGLLTKIGGAPQQWRLSREQIEKAWLYAYLFFFEFSLPFPWHILWMDQDFQNRSIRQVLSPEGEAKYGLTFAYLAGKPLDWAARGLARLDSLCLQEEPSHD